MRILILGSEGFIGRHCVNFFLQKGWDVYGCDLQDHPSAGYNYIKISRLQPSFEEAFTDDSYDVCLNVAGNGSVPVSIEHPLTDFEANCGDVIRILELIRTKSHHCKYIHISSAAVYGNPKVLPVTEDAPLEPISPYGWHKLIAETLCREYSSLYNLAVAVVRPFSVYGPGLRKQLLWDMYRKTLTGSEVELWGDGTETRDFIFISDLINALYIISQHNGDRFNVYNIASGYEASIAEIAEVFYDQIGGVGFSFNNKSRPGDPKNWRADISRLSQLGFKVECQLSEGLKLTAEWLKKSG